MSRSVPGPLLVAAVVVGAQGVALLVYAVLEVASVSAGRATVGITTAAFFAGYAVAVGFCLRALLSLRPWARAPLVVTELIALLLAYDFSGGETTWVAALLLVAAVLALAGLFAPASTEALARDPAP